MEPHLHPLLQPGDIGQMERDGASIVHPHMDKVALRPALKLILHGLAEHRTTQRPGEGGDISLAVTAAEAAPDFLANDRANQSTQQCARARDEGLPCDGAFNSDHSAAFMTSDRRRAGITRLAVVMRLVSGRTDTRCQ